MAFEDSEDVLMIVKCFDVQVSIDGLRSVPLEILKRLETVPEAYLQELGHDHHLFAELPVAVQRQVSLLTSHIHCHR